MENKAKTIKSFLDEYERIKPLNREEFDKNRNADIIDNADDVMELFNCPSWYWFVAACELPVYLEKNGDSVILFSLNVPESEIKEIFPDCNVRSIIKNSIEK